MLRNLMIAIGLLVCLVATDRVLLSLAKKEAAPTAVSMLQHFHALDYQWASEVRQSFGCTTDKHLRLYTSGTCFNSPGGEILMYSFYQPRSIFALSRLIVTDAQYVGIGTPFGRDRGIIYEDGRWELIDLVQQNGRVGFQVIESGRWN